MVIDSLSGGGAEKVVLSLARSMQKRNYRVCIFVLKQMVSYEISDDMNLVFPLAQYAGSIRGWTNTGELSQKLYDAIQLEEDKYGQFDLSLIHLYESYRLASRLPLKNTFYVMHNSYRQELNREAKMGPIKYLYQRNILKALNGKHLIAVSDGVKQELQQATIFTPASVRRIYNPFDIASIQTQSKQPNSMIPSCKYILHVRRAAKAKRHDILFQSFKALDRQYKLVCLSDNVKKLSKLAKRIGIQDRVFFPGFQQNPYSWMKNAELTVLSSDFEGLSMVLIESLICDTKIVSTDCDFGPREIMKNALRPYLCECGNTQQLTEKINLALQYNMTPNDKQILKSVTCEQITNAYIELIP